MNDDVKVDPCLSTIITTLRQTLTISRHALIFTTMKNHHFLEINDYLNFIKLPMEIKSPDFIIYNYDEVQQESWIDLAAYRQHFFEKSSLIC